MKNLALFLTLLFAVMVGRLAWANKHSFEQDSKTSVVSPADIDQNIPVEFETATFALG